jgi:hypothetical protein
LTIASKICKVKIQRNQLFQLEWRLPLFQLWLYLVDALGFRSFSDWPARWERAKRWCFISTRFSSWKGWQVYILFMFCFKNTYWSKNKLSKNWLFGLWPVITKTHLNQVSALLRVSNNHSSENRQHTWISLSGNVTTPSCIEATDSLMTFAFFSK